MEGGYEICEVFSGLFKNFACSYGLMGGRFMTSVNFWKNTRISGQPGRILVSILVKRAREARGGWGQSKTFAKQVFQIALPLQ